MSLRKSHSIFLNSDPQTGARNFSNGSAFEISLESPLVFPRESKNLTAHILQSTIWWSVPNIITGQNDSVNATFLRDDGVNAPSITTQTIQIPQGLYDPYQLFTAINSRFELDHDAQPNLFTPIVDESTGLMKIRINYDNTSLNLNIPNSINQMVGFNYPRTLQRTTLRSTYHHEGDNIVEFNTVNSFLLHADVLDSGITLNSRSCQVIAHVPIDVSPGSQIVYRPINPIKSSCDGLKSHMKQNLRIWITDENNNAIIMPEYFTCILTIEYDL